MERGGDCVKAQTLILPKLQLGVREWTSISGTALTVSKIAAETGISKAQTVETVLHYPGSRESPS